MSFGEKLKNCRIKAKITQGELAKMVGVSSRSIQHYEADTFPPANFDKVCALANALGVSVSTLLDEEQRQLLEASERGGNKARKDISELINEVSAMFAGGELSDNDRDAAFQAITQAYWDAKASNRKYIPKRFRKAGSD